MKARVIYIGLILIVIAIGYFLYDLAVNSKYRISAKDAKKQKYDLILDVRTSLERQTLGYHPDSVHIASADLEKIMPSRYPDKSIKILVYCNTGHRARLATDKLHLLGYKNSVYITEGYKSLL
ncbi:MAG: rhodanese-like domain-containing protein [Alphaproteobacteria bacterium]|nr:rhodanese-like domain-containing protein [Alphaproteobacteria bacterium]